MYFIYEFSFICNKMILASMENFVKNFVLTFLKKKNKQKEKNNLSRDETFFIFCKEKGTRLE